MAKPTWKSPQEWSQGMDWLAAELQGSCRWRLPIRMMGILFAQGRRTVSSWLRADGAYAKRPFLRRAAAAGVVLVCRLRQDAALRDLPPKLNKGQRRPRGCPRKYGKNCISLAKRAGQKRGWKTVRCLLIPPVGHQDLQDGNRSRARSQFSPAISRMAAKT